MITYWLMVFTDSQQKPQKNYHEVLNCRKNRWLLSYSPYKQCLHRLSFGWNEQPAGLKIVWISAKWKTVNAFTYSHALKCIWRLTGSSTNLKWNNSTIWMSIVICNFHLFFSTLKALGFCVCSRKVVWGWPSSSWRMQIPNTKKRHKKRKRNFDLTCTQKSVMCDRTFPLVRWMHLKLSC